MIADLPRYFRPVSNLRGNLKILQAHLSKEQNKERKQQQKTLKKMGSIIATQIQWNFPPANLDNVQVDIGR